MHLEAVYTFIAEDNPSAAGRQVDLVQRIVDQLTGYPQLGRLGRIDGTRELVIPGTPYIAAYRVTDQTVQIVALLHGARRWPGSL